MIDLLKTILLSPIELNLVSIFILLAALVFLLHFIFIVPLRADLLAADLAIQIQCKKIKEQSQELKAYTNTKVKESQAGLLNSLEKSLDSKMKDIRAKRVR